MEPFTTKALIPVITPYDAMLTFALSSYKYSKLLLNYASNRKVSLHHVR